jgi:hypothetical protein
VEEGLKEHLVCTAEGTGVDEYLVTRLECFQLVLSMVNSYSEQESVGPGEQEARWGRLRKELEVIRARGDFRLLPGDLNKLVGCDSLGVQGNDPKVSRGQAGQGPAGLRQVALGQQHGGGGGGRALHKGRSC